MKANTRNSIAICAILAASTALTALPSFGESLKLHPDAPFVALLGQLFTCHIVHCTFEHLFYDALCLAVLGILLSRRELSMTLLLSAPVVSIVVLAVHPELSSYCGLSGVNCALYAVFALKLYRERKSLGIAAFIAIVAKTLLEIFSDRTFFATSGFIPVHEAHLAGIAAGTLCGIAFCIIATRHCKSDMKV